MWGKMKYEGDEKHIPYYYYGTLDLKENKWMDMVVTLGVGAMRWMDGNLSKFYWLTYAYRYDAEQVDPKEAHEVDSQYPEAEPVQSLDLE